MENNIYSHPWLHALVIPAFKRQRQRQKDRKSEGLLDCTVGIITGRRKRTERREVRQGVRIQYHTSGTISIHCACLFVGCLIYCSLSLQWRVLRCPSIRPFNTFGQETMKSYKVRWLVQWPHEVDWGTECLQHVAQQARCQALTGTDMREQGAMFYLPDANHQLPKLASLESSPYPTLKFNSFHCQHSSGKISSQSITQLGTITHKHPRRQTAEHRHLRTAKSRIFRLLLHTITGRELMGSENGAFSKPIHYFLAIWHLLC